jgi:hypothetical protein
MSAAILNNRRKQEFCSPERSWPHRGEYSWQSPPTPIVGAGLPGLIFGERWPSRLVATAAEDRLTQSAHAICGLKSQATKKEEPP